MRSNDRLLSRKVKDMRSIIQNILNERCFPFIFHIPPHCLSGRNEPPGRKPCVSGGLLDLPYSRSGIGKDHCCPHFFTYRNYQLNLVATGYFSRGGQPAILQAIPWLQRKRLSGLPSFYPTGTSYFRVSCGTLETAMKFPFLPRNNAHSLNASQNQRVRNTTVT